MKYEDDVLPAAPPTPTLDHVTPRAAAGQLINPSCSFSSQLKNRVILGIKESHGEDPFDTSFHMNLTKQNISVKEKEKLSLMRNYLKTLSYEFLSAFCLYNLELN